MSTKIYNAYRTKSDPLEILNGLREAAFTIVEGRYLQYEQSIGEFEGIERIIQIRDKCAKASISQTHSEWEVGISCSVIKHGPWWYLKFFINTYAGRQIIKLVDQLEGVHDFHYQNSTDRPEEITPRQWEYRRKMWDTLTEEKYGGTGNYKHWFCFGIFDYLDMWDVGMGILGKKNLQK